MPLGKFRTGARASEGADTTLAGMAQWQPYPTDDSGTTDSPVPGARLETPPWEVAGTAATREVVPDYVSFSPQPQTVNPDLDGDGRIDAAERSLIANRRNRGKWRKAVVSYQPSDGWTPAARLAAGTPAQSRPTTQTEVPQGWRKWVRWSLVIALAALALAGIWVTSDYPPIGTLIGGVCLLLMIWAWPGPRGRQRKDQAR